MSTRVESTHPGEAFKAQASETLHIVTETINDQANALRDSAVTARYNTQEFIETNPWQSVAIAAVIGLLVGIIIGRR